MDGGVLSRAWLLACVALGGGSLLLFALPPPTDWALRRGGPPWALLTAGLAHWNALHLGGNLLGLALIAWLGRRAGLQAPDAAAWLLAGPLAHALLLLHPTPPPYAGLSGWLHAGVGVAALALLQQPGRERLIGAAVLLGLACKLALEWPWTQLRSGDWWGGATLPLAHAAGAGAGLLLSPVLGWARRARRLARRAP